jgi:hypothetical protein
MSQTSSETTLILENRNKLLSAIKEAKNTLLKYDQASVETLLDNIRQDKQHHMLSLSQDSFGKVSFSKTVEDNFNPEKRVKTDFANYVRRKLEVSTKDIPEFVLTKLEEGIFKHLTMQFPTELDKRVVILSGEDLTKFLNKKANTISSKEYSPGPAATLQFFEINSEKIKLAVFDNICYAFIWHCDNYMKVLDYIYPYGDWMERSMFAWAKNNNILTRVEAQSHNLTVTMKTVKLYPSLSTFFCGNISDDEETITLSNTFNWS